MSILIKGVDLPEAYTSAWLTVFECVGEHTFIKTHKVSAEQIQAIPPHGRLVDIEAVYREVTSYYKQRTELQHIALRECLGRVPTIIEAEEGETHETD